MATFLIAPETQDELAGPMSELLDTPVALRAESATIEVNTEYGASKAVRAQVLNLATGEDEGIRLVFWSQVRGSIMSASAKGAWAVGRIEHRAQESDPTRSVYVLTPPLVSNEEIAKVIDAFEAESFVTS